MNKSLTQYTLHTICTREGGAQKATSAVKYFGQ
jgi:hypothetical protein